MVSVIEAKRAFNSNGRNASKRHVRHGWKVDVTPHYIAIMIEVREKALREFKRMVTWIVGIGVLMAVGAIVYLALSGDLYLHMVIATLGGVFFSVVLGCGLMAAGFFSDKSGHDQSVTDATTHEKDGKA